MPKFQALFPTLNPGTTTTVPAPKHHGAEVSAAARQKNTENHGEAVSQVAKQKGEEMQARHSQGQDNNDQGQNINGQGQGNNGKGHH